MKLFRRLRQYYSKPFYEGIGQALALGNYGFDHIGLWFLFLQEDLDILTKTYGPSAWELIREKFGIPLEFSYFGVVVENNRLRFRVWDRKGSYLGVEIDSSRFIHTWKHPSPLRQDNNAFQIRKALELWLRGGL